MPIMIDGKIQLDFLAARQMIQRNLALCNADELQELINENSGLLAHLPCHEYTVWPRGCRVGEVKKK